MCRLSPFALSFLVASLCLFFARPVTAALPPGYEDVMWCPPDYCRRDVQNEPGMAGPARIFNECYNPATDDVVDEVWTGELTDVEAPEGWVENPADCPDDEVEETGEEGEFGDIIASCSPQISAGIACFTTSQEAACEGFDPMSLLAGDLPVPTDCDEGAQLVCAALVGCCDQEIIDIAACAAKTNLDLDCDIDCTPDDTTSGGSNGASAVAFVLAILVRTLGILFM